MRILGYKIKFRQYFRKLLEKNYKKSYSQHGEDIIMDSLFRSLDIKKPTYVDIGAYHPFKFNNTYFFYKNGCTGVNIEPDPVAFKSFTSKRNRDINLNVGIAQDEGELDFYVLSPKTLSTFNKKIAEGYNNLKGCSIEQVLKVKVVNVNTILNNFFKATPTFISLDVEGLEMDILKSFDFDKFRPVCFIIETITFVGSEKVTEIIDFMISKNYKIHADTFINTIFVDNIVWSKRPVLKNKNSD